MKSYLLKRFFLMIPTFLGITLVTFLIIQLAPGNPVSLKIQQLGGEGVRASRSFFVWAILLYRFTGESR